MKAQIKLTQAESALRRIAKAQDQKIIKRRPGTMRDVHGVGYGVVDLKTNALIGGGTAQDGCGMSLSELASFYKDDLLATQNRTAIMKAIKAGTIVE